MSLMISERYFVSSGSIVPPPPKHPQSILRPLAHACAIAIINANIVKAPNAPEIFTVTPTIKRSPSPISIHGRVYPKKLAIGIGNISYALTAIADFGKLGTLRAPATSKTAPNINLAKRVSHGWATLNLSTTSYSFRK